MSQAFFTQMPPPAGRSPLQLQTYERLQALGIAFVGVDHPPAATIADCAAADAALGVHMCKNLFLTDRRQSAYYLLLMPGEKPLRTAQLSAQLGTSRLQFASPEALQCHLGVTPGAVTVLALLWDEAHAVQLLIDRDLLQYPYLGCHPCENTASVRIATADMLQRLLPATGHVPRVVDL